MLDDKNLVFLSYASPDLSCVLPFHDYLARVGFNVWMDKHRLKGGQNWDFEIKRALQKAVVVVVFLSANSVDRRGYAQREIKMALDQARDKLIDDIYLVPVMLDEGVTVPPQLEQIQVIQAADGNAPKAVAEAINLQLERLGVETARVQGETKLRWTTANFKDVWEGLPGHDTSFQLLRFSSEEYPRVGEITDVIHGELLTDAMAQRETKFGQSPELFNFGKDRFFRQNTWEASCGEPKIKDRVLSVAYTIWWYGAGAAHPNNAFATFAFTLDPVTRIASLEEVFQDQEKALEVIQAEVRSKLLAQTFDDMTNDNKPLRLDEEYVNGGTNEWGDFSSFVFAQDGVDILFSSYQVAPYAFGPQVATVEYDKLAKLMHTHYACLLGIEHLASDAKPWPFEAAGTSEENQSAA